MIIKPPNVINIKSVLEISVFKHEVSKIVERKGEKWEQAKSFTLSSSKVSNIILFQSKNIRIM